MGYVVVKCPKCGNVFITSDTYGNRYKKTTRCPRCGKRIELKGYRSFTTLEEARRLRNKLLAY